MTRQDRENALSENVNSPIRTLSALQKLTEAELSGLERHVSEKQPDANMRAASFINFPAGYNPYGEPPDGYRIAIAKGTN